MEPQGWVRACCFVTPDCLIHSYTPGSLARAPAGGRGSCIKRTSVKTGASSERHSSTHHSKGKNHSLDLEIGAPVVDWEETKMKPCSGGFLFLVLFSETSGQLIQAAAVLTPCLLKANNACVYDSLLHLKHDLVSLMLHPIRVLQ